MRLPRELKKIGRECFSGCVSLSTLDLPDTVEEIGNAAFFLNGFKSIVLPSSLRSLSDGLFKRCEQLASITFNKSLTSVGNNVFHDCGALTFVDMSNTEVESIGMEVFYDCDKLETLR